MMKSISSMICECGCGGEPKTPGSRFLRGHNRGRPWGLMERPLCACGCGMSIDPRCRFAHGHNGARELASRFWSKVQVGAEPDCWEWQGALTPFGYGNVQRRYGGSKLAHRVAWELSNGAIPEGLHICHHCDNPPCVNPKHLFLGTARDNSLDMRQKGRWKPGKARRGVDSPQAKLTEEAVRELRDEYLPGRGGAG